MLRLTTQRLAAATLVIVLGGFVLPAYPETDQACADTPAQLRRHLAANNALERLHALRDFMEQAIEASGHAPHTLVGKLFAEPLAIASASAKTRSLLPEATPLESTPLRESPLDAVIDRLDRIHGQLEIALAEVTDEHADQLRRLLPELLARTSNGSDLEDIEHGAVLAEIQAALDQPALEQTAALLAGLAQPEVAASLAEHFRDQPAGTAPAWLDAHVAGDIIDAQRTARGAVIVGGPGTNIYTGPAAVIIDTGGDDIYALPAGDAVRIIIDLEGNDTYTGQADAVLAGSVLGASLIADHAGDDTHAGGNISQGAAVAGIGMLVDYAGNDRYFGAELAQGASLAGIGVLVDKAGDDLYTAARFAQGFGGALGTGVLTDRAGNDTYLAGNRNPSSYDVPGNYQAFSQGVGMGFRNDIAGGIGLLRDHAGDDQYTAGNYSQGTGYYLGAGLLIDEAGNDAYSGGRYTQGAAAHLGVGLLRDEAGNDTYAGSVSASQGGAWDLAIAALVDCAGDDNYTTNEFGLGAAAQYAIGLFFDAGGHDAYSAKRDALGHAGPNDYHKNADHDEAVLGNLGVFIDAGNQGEDRNGATRVSPARDQNDENTADRGAVPDIPTSENPSAAPGRPRKVRAPENTLGRGAVPDARTAQIRAPENIPHPVVPEAPRKARRYPGPREPARAFDLTSTATGS